MNEVITNPIFGIMVSILAYLMGMLIFRRDGIIFCHVSSLECCTLEFFSGRFSLWF